MHARNRRIRTIAGLIACSLAAALILPKCAAADQPEKPSVSDKVSEMFTQLKPLTDEKKWDQALSLLDGILPSLDPTSYDAAICLDTKAKIFLQKEQPENAIAPWEAVLKLNETKNYFDAKSITEINHVLAQVYTERAQKIKIPSSPSTPAEEAEVKRLNQQEHDDFVKAIGYAQTWFKNEPHLREEDEFFYGSLLYNVASQGTEGGGELDQKLLADAVAEAKKALLLSIHPKEQTYLLLVAALQSQQKSTDAAEYLELLVRLFPQKGSSYYPQLMATYLNMAGSLDKDPIKQEEYQVRAISAIERAQAAGFMKAPKDNMNLVTTYYMLEQYGLAADLLGRDLRNGTIESTEKNWQVLAYCYTRLDQPAKAIAAYKEAETHFPDSGQIDVLIGQLYSSQDDAPNAYKYYAAAVKKGNLTTPPLTVYSFLAYSAFELERYDDALAACDAAAKLPDAAGDTALQKLRQGIIETKKNKEAEKAAQEQQIKDAQK